MNHTFSSGSCVTVNTDIMKGYRDTFSGLSSSVDPLLNAIGYHVVHIGTVLVEGVKVGIYLCLLRARCPYDFFMLYGER